MVYRLGHGALRSAVLLLATGAVADQLTRWFTTDPTVVAVVWGALLLGAWWFTARPYATAAFDSSALGRRTTTLTLVVGIVVALAGYRLSEAAQGRATFRLADLMAAVVVLGGAVGWYAAGRTTTTVTVRYHHWWKRRDSAVLAACMFFAATMAALTFRASTDDFYYVNFSTYIYEHGVIPTRDTVLSDQVYPGYKRFSSWELLWGVVGRLVHVPPAYLLYLVVIPAATALSIVALAHLIDTAGIREYKPALIAGTVFLAFDGATGFTFGSYQGPRIWQGKSFFLAVLLPLLVSYLIRLLRQRSWRTVTDVALATVACVGATTSSFIICVPVIAAAALLAVRRRHALLPLAGALGYVVTCAVTFKYLREETGTSTHMLGSAAPLPMAEYSTNTVTPQTYDLLTKLAHPGWHAALFAAAVCWGWVALRGGPTRHLTAALLGVWGLICLPGALGVVLSVTGSQSVAWRYIWLIPIPLLIAATGSTLAELAAGGPIDSRATAIRGYAAAGAWVLALAAAPMLLGTPPWSTSSGAKMEAELAKPWSLRVGYGYREAVRALDDIAQPGDIVLARNGLSASINSMSTRYVTVAPRPVYALHVLRGAPDGFALERIALATYVTGEQPVVWQPGQLADALRKVRVDVVCITSDHTEMVSQFTQLGYTHSATVSRKDGKLSVWCGRTDAYTP